MLMSENQQNTKEKSRIGQVYSHQRVQTLISHVNHADWQEQVRSSGSHVIWRHHTQETRHVDQVMNRSRKKSNSTETASVTVRQTSNLNLWMINRETDQYWCEDQQMWGFRGAEQLLPAGQRSGKRWLQVRWELWPLVTVSTHRWDEAQPRWPTPANQLPGAEPRRGDWSVSWRCCTELQERPRCPCSAACQQKNRQQGLATGSKD